MRPETTRKKMKNDGGDPEGWRVFDHSWEKEVGKNVERKITPGAGYGRRRGDQRGRFKRKRGGLSTAIRGHNIRERNGKGSSSLGGASSGRRRQVSSRRRNISKKQSVE